MWTRRKNEATANGRDVDLSLLGKNARFKGVIMFEGTARIDGRLEGDISTDGILVIGEEAVVEGNIVASVNKLGQDSGEEEQRFRICRLQKETVTQDARAAARIVR